MTGRVERPLSFVPCSSRMNLSRRPAVAAGFSVAAMAADYGRFAETSCDGVISAVNFATFSTLISPG